MKNKETYRTVRIVLQSNRRIVERESQDRSYNTYTSQLICLTWYRHVIKKVVGFNMLTSETEKNCSPKTVIHVYYILHFWYGGRHAIMKKRTFMDTKKNIYPLLVKRCRNI